MSPETPRDDTQPRTRREAREMAERRAAASRGDGTRGEGAGSEATGAGQDHTRGESPAATPPPPQEPAAQDVSDVPDAAEGPELDLFDPAPQQHRPPPPHSRHWSHAALEPEPQPPKKKRRWLPALIVTIVVVALIGGGGLFVWNTFQPQVMKLLAMNEPTDYTGKGTGSVMVTVKDGDGGGAIATTLHKAGVVKTYAAFYDLLLHTKPDPVFQPGVYQLKKQMSAESALTLLQDPKSKLTRAITIPEGQTQAQILPELAKTTGVPLADLTAAAKPADFGLPAQAKSLEGFLFPATYNFDPGVTAHDALNMLVDRTMQSLDDAGVAPADRWKTVVLASIVQKEAGPNPDDLGKIARVFQNRLDDGMALQSDATVSYGAGSNGKVFTSDAQRNDASNPYNTYAHTGLPIGPISNPGDGAIKAAHSPTPGPWLYFVAVNLQTGETEFSTTDAEHEKAVQKLQAWCKASAANDALCQ